MAAQKRERGRRGKEANSVKTKRVGERMGQNRVRKRDAQRHERTGDRKEEREGREVGGEASKAK